ncbi:unnamed protein product [Trichobilharzia regenti]|nr:unnamed protein product [Trichobilharzia regenti]
MTLPIVLGTDLVKVFNLNACWFTENNVPLLFYKSLFSDTCFAQLALVTIIDVFFVVKVIKWSRGRHQLAGTQSSEMKNILSTITLLVLHITVLLFALPYAVSLLLTNTVDSQRSIIPVEFVRVILLTMNIGWILIFLQSSLNILLYTVLIQKFRQVLLKKFNCFVCKSIDAFESSVRNQVKTSDTQGI